MPKTIAINAARNPVVIILDFRHIGRFPATVAAAGIVKLDGLLIKRSIDFGLLQSARPRMVESLFTLIANRPNRLRLFWRLPR
jgi:hypothetical protein